jgi:hypothetical protein
MAGSRRTGGVALARGRIIAMPPKRFFFRRMVRSTAIATGVVGSGLLIGMLGYHWLGRMTWQEAFYYAAMILSGEGPPPDPQPLTASALSHLHLFSGFYALFSGVTFITTVGVLFAPAVHRFLHRFHLEITTDDGGQSP